MNPLAWLGAHSSGALASLVFLGLAVPWLGENLKNFVDEAIVLLLFVAFLRLDLNAFKTQLRSPGWIIGATLWTMLLVPLFLIVLFKTFQVDSHFDQLYPALVFQASASPLMAAPAFAAILGLDATLILITLVVSTALTPLLAPIYATLAGVELNISATTLGLKLLFILVGTAICGIAMQKYLGPAKLKQYKQELDGINVILLLVFVCAIIGNVRDPLLASPLKVLSLTLLSFAIFFALFAATYLVFKTWSKEKALSISLLVSNRNMGLLIAASGGALPELTWMYFAVAQLPIYFCPQIVKPLLKQLR